MVYAARLLARAYAVLLGVLAAYAWCLDIMLLHSPREHLLGDFLLAIASMPASLSLGLFCNMWPGVCAIPFCQLAWVTVCGVVQATIIFLFAGVIEKARYRNRKRDKDAS